MTGTPDDMSLAENRLRRLSVLEQDMAALHVRMHSLADDINGLMERAGVRRPRTDDNPTGWTVRARVQSLGARTVRYGWRDRETRKITSRTWLVESGDDGHEFLFTLPQPWMAELLELDSARRLLNHQSRAIYGEHQSLKRLHQSHEDLDQALAGKGAGEPEPLTM